MKRPLLYLFSLLWLISSCSGKQEPVSSLLWKIKTQDGKESYLFGTMHEYPQDRISISAQTIAGLKASTVLVTERNVWDPDDQRLFAEQNQHKPGARTEQVIDRHYEGRLKHMEAELMRIADRHRIPVTGLETAQEVLSLLSQVPVPLEENLSEAQIIARHEQLISMYNSGNFDLLAEEVLDKELGAETRRLMVDQRNLNWLDDIERLIQSGGAFIAVGMGHLGGQHGLVHLLRQKGYRIEELKP